MKNIITLKNLKRDYITKGEVVHALCGITLDVEDGEFIAVVGRSGSGKSTLMNILGCLDKPTDGEYILDGINISALGEKQLTYIRSNVIGFIFQSFNLIPTLTALENAELPLLYRGIGKKERKLRAEYSLERVGLSARKNHLPCELSGGQQQRVAVARAIASEPKILLADEPTGSLDKKSGEEILGIIKSLNDDGVTVIMITHDNSIAQRAKRCIKISDGKIIQ